MGLGIQERSLFDHETVVCMCIGNRVATSGLSAEYWLIVFERAIHKASQ